MIKSTEVTEIIDLSVDLGNMMLKAATIKNGEILTVKAPNKVQTNNPTDKSKHKFIKVGDKQGVYVGVGKLNNNVLKHTRENLLEQVIAMSNEFYSDVDSLAINLKVGLPFKFYDTDKFVEELKENFPTDQWIKYTINEDDKELYINKVEVFVEGYSAFESIVEKIGQKQRVLLIDVGGETTDLSSFTYNYETEEYDVDDAYTVELGVISLVSEITKAINDDLGADINVSTIDNLLRTGQQEVFYGGQDHRLSDYIKAIDNTVKSMITEITNEFGALDNYYIVGLGGGFDVFNAIANQYIKANIEISSDERFFANAIGYLAQ